MAQLVDGSSMGTWSGYTRYVYLTGDVNRSGNTVYLTNLEYHFTATYAAAYGYDETISIEDSGGSTLSSTGIRWNFSGGTSPTVSLNDASFSVGMSDTYATLRLASDDGSWVSFGVSFPSGGSAPSNPTISNVIVTPTALTATLNVSSWGNPSSGRFEYYFGTTPTTTDNYTYNPTSGYTSNLSVTMNRTGLTPDTNYYIRVRVWNSVFNNPGGFILGGPYRTRPAVKLYGSVNGQTKEVKKLYGSLNGQTKGIKKVYGSVGGQTKLIYQA